MNSYQKRLLIFLIFFITLIIVIGIYWLLIGLFVAYLFLLIPTSNNLIIFRLRRMKYITYSYCFLIVVLVSIGTRIFLFEIFTIPSISMEDTILSGDKFLMSKLSYGPRLSPSTNRIQRINLPFTRYNKDSIGKYIEWGKYKRLKGFSNVKRNDIIVFNSPKDAKILIKRCVGLPGDTFLMRNGKVF
ncbi:MAG: signal peptidase I, partial [Bacteroidetes bacterium]